MKRRTGLVVRAVAAVVLVVAAAVILDVATYDPRPWQARHRLFKTDVQPLARAAVALGRLKRADVMALDRQTSERIGSARSRVRAYLAVRKFERLFADDRLDLGRFDRAAWLADYRRLKQDLAQGYANLDWMVQHRGVDLRKLDAATEAALGRATSTSQALAVLAGFLRSFKDPHLKIAVAEAGTAAGAGVAQTTASNLGDSNQLRQETPATPAAVTSCKAAGYEEDEHTFRFPFAQLPGWQPLAAGNFPSGIFADVGVLRIAQLGETSYLAACQKAFQPGLAKAGLKRAVRALLQRQLIERLNQLKARGARRLLVDVSGNGGGTEWVQDVTALMTDRPMSRFAGRKVAPACDRSGIWRGESVCPVLEDFSRTERKGTGPWTGPVIVLADRETGSATEDFVAWLRENRIAKIVGERTGGAGCGYFNGGTPSRLQVLPLEVLMPNCARFLDDRSNEVEGIAPTIEMPMRLSDPKQQATALLTALEKT